MSAASIGMVYAVCDHFESQARQPAVAKILKGACNVTREQLRKWVREGRLEEFDAISKNGQRQKAYRRPSGQEVQ